jgi:hypothetical protein
MYGASIWEQRRERALGVAVEALSGSPLQDLECLRAADSYLVRRRGPGFLLETCRGGIGNRQWVL